MFIRKQFSESICNKLLCPLSAIHVQQLQLLFFLLFNVNRSLSLSHFFKINFFLNPRKTSQTNIDVEHVMTLILFLEELQIQLYQPTPYFGFFLQLLMSSSSPLNPKIKSFSFIGILSRFSIILNMMMLLRLVFWCWVSTLNTLMQEHRDGSR